MHLQQESARATPERRRLVITDGGFSGRKSAPDAGMLRGGILPFCYRWCGRIANQARGFWRRARGLPVAILHRVGRGRWLCPAPVSGKKCLFFAPHPLGRHTEWLM